MKQAWSYTRGLKCELLVEMAVYQGCTVCTCSVATTILKAG
jgi:hypothetical protein